MAIPHPLLMCPLRRADLTAGTDATEYTVRITTDGAGGSEDLTFPDSGTLGSTTDYYMSTDGDASTDLVQMLETVIEAHQDIDAATVTINSSWRVSVTVDTFAGGATEFSIDWDHANTTLDGNVYGWAADTASSSTVTASYVPMGHWRPGAPVTSDGRNRQLVVGGVASTLSGKSRVSSMIAPASAPKTRDMEFRNLLKTVMLDEYMVATEPYSSFERNWHYSIALGRLCRFYTDEDAISTATYDELSIRDLGEPYRRAQAYSIRWDVDLLWNLNAEVTA